MPACRGPARQPAGRPRGVHHDDAGYRPEHTSFPAACLAQGFRLVPVEHQDAWSVRELPPARTDPFDRLIAATARWRRWAVGTADRAFDRLDVDVVRP